MAMTIYKVVTGKLPDRPPGPNEWLSDDIWDFLSRCWSPSRDRRPDVRFAMNLLYDAAGTGMLKDFESGTAHDRHVFQRSGISSLNSGPST